jgi:hypothetical protein
MRSLRSLVIFAAAAALLAPAYASAQVESTPIPTTGKPNFSAMEFLIGTWSCSTKSSRRPTAFHTTITYALDSTGYWINQSSTTNPVSWVPTPAVATDRITYDATTKRWIDVNYDNQGGYGLSVSKGWDGDRISWHDVSFAPTADISSQSSTVTTKVSATKETSESAFTEAKTGRHVTVSTVCTKT